ncbi:Bcr/CflA family multidrug efflux MFS transporter [Shewanella sp. SNU WT4]|uniref:purine nucleoside transporter PunC n=1 Tax=Shewanella sp. SNU WT4 TaxID=2590015 RepID=UPI00112D5D17|nr:purine nucleoside transporter PunC [Shewanella sp. SNU WT4]QDF67068.1 Bcr/CflA family multidrug efflux MFS transporter [Shewanella sp. SNU WT4]
MKKTNSIKFYMFLFYLSMLSMLGFIATDMYLPAFNAIETTFNTTPTQVAMSLTTFLAGLACGQLAYGPLVAKIGKRNALFGGLALFGAASIAIANSDSMMAVNIARFCQALGACSAAVIWQALVIEQYDADEAQGIFSNIMPLVALSPALAPILGAFVQHNLGWRAIFVVLTVIAAMLIIMTFILVPGRDKTAPQQTHSATGFIDILKNTKFLGSVIIFGACSGAFFSYLTVWPIVMEQHGYAAAEIGLSFIPQTIMFIVGGYASKTLISKFGSDTTLKILLAQFGLCVLVIFLSTVVFKFASIFPLLITFSILAASSGGIYPIVVNNALQQFTQDATKAAGVQNFLQLALAFGASTIVATWASAGEVAIGWGIMICAIGVLLGFLLQKDSKISDVEAMVSAENNTAN